MNEAHDWAGPQTVMHDTPEGVVVQQTQEVAPFLEANVAEYNSGNPGNVGGWGRKVASIPMGVVLEWFVKFGVDALNKDHAPAVRRLLDSNEYRYLRTAPGTLGRH